MKIFKTVLFQAIQFSSNGPKDRTLSVATTPGLNGFGSDGNKGVPGIPQSPIITGASKSNIIGVLV